MIEVLLGIAAGLGVLLSLAALHRASELREELQRLRQALERVDQGPPAPPLEAREPSPLEGLRVKIAVSQDHQHPTFSNLLAEHLERGDAEAVVNGADRSLEGADVLITGNVRCNGYSDVYFHADLQILSSGGTLDTIREDPADGGRQASLATTTAARLARALETSLRRAERRLALRELQG